MVRGGVTGAIGAQLAGAVIGLFATIAYLTHRGRTQPKPNQTVQPISETHASHRHGWSSVATMPETQAMLASGSILVMLTLDAALVARLFNAEDTATYSAVTILGRSQFYLSATVATLLLPYVASQGGGNPRAALGYGLAITGILNGTGLLILGAIPDLVVDVLYGRAYVSAAPLLWHYGLHSTMLSIGNVVATYLIGRGNRSIGNIALTCTTLQVAVVTIWHPTLNSVIIGLGAGSATLLGCGLLLAQSSNTTDK